MRKCYSFSIAAKIVLSIVFLIFAICKSKAQVDIIVGTGSTGNDNTEYPCPIQDYYEGSRAQYLFKASELSALGMGPGNINAIKFNVTNLNSSGVAESYAIKIGSTTVNTLSTSSWLSTGAALYGPVDYQPVQGVNTFVFTTPFFWNGSDNIVVEVCNGDPNSTGSITYTFNVTVPWTTNLGFNGSHTYRNDNEDNLCGTTSTDNTGVTTTRPNIIFNWTSATPCSGPPNPGTVSTTTNNLCLGQSFTLTASGVTVASGLTFQWQSSADNVTWTDIPGANSLSYTGSQSASSYYRFHVTCGAASANAASVFINSPALVSGTFTINNTVATGGTNFNNFNDAYNYMKCGINGPIVFNVLNGPYNEQLNMSAIPGASPVNTITFNGNGKSIGFATANTNSRAVIKLDSVRYVILDSLVVNANTGTYGYGIQLIRNSDSNIIRKCVINSSTTSVSQNFAGIVINAADAGAISTGITLCDYNTFSDNTIKGGYYGITLVGSESGANGFNTFSGNDIRDFYQYGMYVSGSYNTVIENNMISRPSRTTVSGFYGIYFTELSTLATISGNRITNPFGGAPASSGAFYGIDFENVNTPATYDHKIINNLVVSSNGNGLAYGISNTSSGNVSYFHNTISISNSASTAFGATRGFNQSSSADGIYFFDNIISITRGGTGAKHCIYFSSSSSSVTSDYNNLYMGSTSGSVNAVGYNGVNRTTLVNWRTAAQEDLFSVSANPVFADTAAGNYKPQNAAFDNKGIYLGVDTDIVGMVRDQATPDMGAYEFVPPPCITPPTPGNTVFNYSTTTDTAVCVNVAIELGLKNNSFGFTQTFQWQTSPALAGPYTSIGTPLAYPDTLITSSVDLYYRCAVTCGNSTTYSNPLKLTVNPALPAGTYTINFANPTTWPSGKNFKTFNDAKASMNCGVAGPVVFNIVPGSGPYEEQLKLDTIPGSSAVNTITFNGNGNTIHFSSANAVEKAVIKLSHASHIVFDSLVINAAGAAANGFGVQLLNNADSNVFRKCSILTSQTSLTTNYAGVVISGFDAVAASPGAPFCDGNLFDGNTITGGYYGIVAVANTSSVIRDNRFTNNTISDFYSYGIYLGAGNASTIIESNRITRPARTTATASLYGIYITGASTRISVSKNRVYNLSGGAATGTNTVYGIYHKDADATSGNSHNVVNNLLYNFTGNGPVYAIANDGSSYVNYYHNTIAVDNTGGAGALARGFYLASFATGIQFKNNLISVTRSGSGVKHAIYIADDAAEIELDYNEYYVNPGGSPYFIGYRTSNQPTLADWQTATAQEANSLSIEPGFADPATGNYASVVAPLDNKGTPVGIANDINGVVRSTTTPDIGAYEFTVPQCTAITSSNATVNPTGGICVEVPITLDVPGVASAAGLKFVWQNAPSATGPWTDISDSLYLARFTRGALANEFYRAAAVCNGSVNYTNVVQVNMNPLLLAGTYTIDKTPPAGATNNFLSFGDAVNALSCGITGAVIFNVAADTYTEQIEIGRVPGVSATSNVTFQSANGVASSVNLTYSSTLATANYVLKFDSSSYLTFRNLTITAGSSTLGRVVEFSGTSSHDSLLACTIVAPATVSTAGTMAAVYATSFTGANLVIKGNTIRNGSTGIYLVGSSTSTLSSNDLIDSNTVSGAYNYGIYASFTSRVKISNNTVNASSPAAAISYGIYTSKCDNAYHISGNKVNINNVTGSSVYGIYVVNCNAPLNDTGVVAGNTIIAGSGNTAGVYGLTNYTSSGNNTVNNVIAIKSAGATSYGLYSFNSNDINYYNNSINSAVPLAANSYAAYFSHTASTSNIKIRNNIFSNKGVGKALYVNNPTLFAGDYNTLYAAGTTLVQVASPAAQYATLKAWSNAYYWDVNSIVYPPAFVSDTNLQPDLTNPNVWAIHGRGVQVPGNNYDFNNNPRPTALTEGVPDMGAYEFFPSALPTVLTAIPVAPAANQTQTFMYGTDTVMKITWGASAPATVAVRRYSGVVPQGLPPASDSMYFYTAVEIPGGGSYPYSIQQFYIDPWQGSIDDQHSIGLGKTTPSNAWVVGFSSTVDINKNVIAQSNLDYIDKFTGLVNPYAPPVGPDRDSSNKGKRFWVGYAKSYDFTSGDNSQEMVLYLSTDQQAANVQVKINGTNYVRNYAIPPNTVRVSDLIPKSGINDARLFDEGFYNRGISITSDVPIVAYAHIYSSANSGATMLMPTGVYGYEYYTLNSKQNYADTSAYSSFFVVSDNDNTKIEITPSSPTLGGRPANVAFTIVLNKGEVYQVLGALIAGDEGYDLTGSKVKSIANSSGKCFPIAVFAGSTRTSLACGSGIGFSGDVIFQQIFPSQAWGKRYLTAPTSTDNDPGSLMTNIYRVMVKDPATVVKVNNAVLNGITNNRFYQFESNTADIIESDKPILVAQYMSSTGSCPNTDGNGDPEMFYLSPVEQAVNYTGFYRNDLTAIEENYVTMIIPNNGLNSLTIDGVAWANIPANQKFSYVHPNASNYTVVIKRWSSTPGQSIVKSDSAFTGIVYGLGSVESYGYNMGTLVKNLQATGSITNSLNTSGAPTDFTCANSPFRFTAKLPLVPTSLTWNFSRTPSTPNRDTTFINPVPTDTVNINGVTYYTFTFNQEYTFPAPGVYGVPILYAHPDIESCDHTREDLIYVQVLPAPKTNFNVSFSGCTGDIATFKADSLTENGITVNQWAWTFHDTTSASSANAVFTYPTPGTYLETLRTVTADGCIGDTTKPVVVNPRPVADVVEDSLVVCSGTDTSFNVLNPVSGATYNWFNSATGGTSSASGVTLPVTNVTDTAYYFLEGEQAGCTSTVRKQVMVSALTPLAVPVVSLDVAGGDSIRFKWNAVPLAIGYEVSVDSGNTFITPSSGATGLTHTVTGLQPLQQVSIQVRALADVSCQSSISDTVSACLAESISVITDSLPACSDSSVTFKVKNPVSSVTYSWYNAATGGTALATGETFTVNNVTAAANYFVEGVSAGGCNSGRTKVSVSVFNTLPSPVVRLDSAAISADSLRFTWSAVQGAVGYEVSVNGNPYITPSSGVTGLSHTITGLAPLQQASIVVRALGSVSCQNSLSDTVKACLANPVLVANDSIPICSDSSVTFQVQSPAAGVNYSWYNVATGGTAAATGATFTVSNVTAGTNYYVEGVSAAGCNSGRTKVTIAVLNQLAAPVVQADSAASGADFLVFTWSAVPGATGYEVSVNGGPFAPPSSGTSGLTHRVSGLPPFQQVTLQVRAISLLACQQSAPGSATAGTRTNMVFIPNTFTPNGDGRNDRWLVYSNVIRSMHLLIFNQWGEKVFESNNQQDGWDGTYKGKAQPVGVYIYVSKIALTDGSVVDKKGSINLVR